jgi:hypothetical protein
MMSITACSLVIAATLAGGSADPITAGTPALIAAAVAETRTPATIPEQSLRAVPAIPAAWTIDRPVSGRPAALPVMYLALGGLQAFDVYSTRRALTAGADEANPLMKHAAQSSGTMLAVKALSTAGTIYFAEKMWKKNRKGAMILMAVVNGATAAVALRNMRNAR